MSSKPSDQQNPEVVVDGHDEPVVVALDIKDHSLSIDDAGGTVLLLKFCRCSPVDFLDFCEPRVEPLLHSLLLIPGHSVANEIVQSSSGDDSHLNKHTLAPNMGASTKRLRPISYDRP